MKITAIGGGAYRDDRGEFWVRPTINGRRTWRKLDARTARKAVVEANQQAWAPRVDSFESLAKLWVQAGCPGKRKQADISGPKKAAQWLVRFFGRMRCNEIRLVHLPQYAEWRRKFIRKGHGGRTVDLDLVTLSNIQRYGVFSGLLEFNYVRADRPRYAAKARHARVVMPESAEVIHRLAGEFLADVRSEVMGWLCFFSEFTGCRHSELRRLRLDAQNNREPGFIEWLSDLEKRERGDGVQGYLYLQRSKGGLNPYARIGPEFAQMLRAFAHWHAVRHGDQESPRWYFPGKMFGTVIGKESFGHALTKLCRDLKLPHVTPHGFRAYYATKRLRDGARTKDIAAEMGDQTVSLIEDIYTQNPDGKKLWWTPPDGLAAWAGWLPGDLAEKNGLKMDCDLKKMVPRCGLEPQTN